MLSKFLTPGGYVVLALAFGLLSFGHPATATGAAGSLRPLTLYIVRHAEKVNDSDSSPLTRRGKVYAEGLALLLQGRGITRIFTSDLRRAKDTARPLDRRLRASSRRVRWVTLDSDDPKQIGRTLEQLRDGNGVLLVGRSNFVPELVQDLSGRDVRAERNRYYRLYHLVRIIGQKHPFTYVPAPVWKPAPGSGKGIPPNEAPPAGAMSTSMGTMRRHSR